MIGTNLVGTAAILAVIETIFVVIATIIVVIDTITVGLSARKENRCNFQPFSPIARQPD